MRPLRNSYVILALISATLFGLFIVLPSVQEGLRGLILNLATEIVGIIVTVVFIDSVIRRGKQREQERYRSVALRQMHGPLSSHLNLLFLMYKVSVKELPKHRVSQATELFSDEYFEQIAHLNIASESPMPFPFESVTDLCNAYIVDPSVPNMLWSEYLNKEAIEFRRQLGIVVDKYAGYLDSRILELIEAITRTLFIQQSVSSHSTLILERSQGRLLRGYAGFPSASPNAANHVREHTELFCEFLDYYNKHMPENKKLSISDRSWSTEDTLFYGKTGSARV